MKDGQNLAFLFWLYYNDNKSAQLLLFSVTWEQAFRGLPKKSTLIPT